MSLALQTFATVPEASSALQSAGARYLGGGTLVVRAASEGDLSIGSFVRTTDANLRRIEVNDGQVTLGASVTMAQIVRHNELDWLAKAARSVGGPAIRNMATVGGNLFAPAPYGDFGVALLALGSTVSVGDQRVSIDDFFAERARQGGIVTSVQFKLPREKAFRYLKVSRIKPKGVSVLSIAAVLETAADGVITDARIGLGCMADRPMRAISAENALIGSRLSEDGVAAAVAVVGEGTTPITDPIASAWYRSEVLPVHFRRLLLA